MANHGNTERHILELLRESKTFNYLDENYKILKIGKPRPAKGECKTDIYIQTITSKLDIKEFKISIKQHDADFLENKISLDRAIEILGEDAQSLIQESVLKIRTTFENDILINVNKYKRTEPNCIKIGWKFELINKLGGEKSGLIELNESQKIDIYSGINLNITKKDCIVNGEVITDSGVANYILEVDEIINDLDYYLNKLVEIDNFAKTQDIYFACKAINYRVDKDKWDGDRPLSVYCQWFKNTEGKLDVRIIYNNPLSIKANSVGNEIRKLLLDLKIDKNNFNSIKDFISTNVRFFG